MQTKFILILYLMLMLAFPTSSFGQESTDPSPVPTSTPQPTSNPSTSSTPVPTPTPASQNPTPVPILVVEPQLPNVIPPIPPVSVNAPPTAINSSPVMVDLSQINSVPQGNTQVITPPIDQSLLNDNMAQESFNQSTVQQRQILQNPGQGSFGQTSVLTETQPTFLKQTIPTALINPPGLKTLFLSNGGSYYQDGKLPLDVTIAFFNLSAFMIASGVLFLRWDHFRSQLSKAFSEFDVKREGSIKQGIHASSTDFWKQSINFS